ncbi:GNAT family N-acetyltransferase [Paenibacillus xylaniclasticus]|uniref:GNAT family N-acetyltransferase n=1 Tax=Paenibacillus xylaniclasticus TaxID=588083 RepID=UPI000FD7970D|nr:MULTISPECIES: GNAT family N-acetyltransferase [Paenibacillus]GFN33780.1 N-acetyltransferase [Paenibacillus curdlanolyticus]
MPRFVIERLLLESSSIQLVLTRQDDPFMMAVYEAVRRVEMAGWGWEEEAAASFLAMQYSMQQRSYEMYYPESSLFIVSIEGASAGKLHVAEGDQAITLVDIALLPTYQGRGAGTILLRGLQRYAQEAGKPLRLTVNTDSRALRLYEKLGFRTLEANEVNTRMEWNAVHF